MQKVHEIWTFGFFFDPIFESDNVNISVSPMSFEMSAQLHSTRWTVLTMPVEEGGGALAELKKALRRNTNVSDHRLDGCVFVGVAEKMLGEEQLPDLGLISAFRHTACL